MEQSPVSADLKAAVVDFFENVFDVRQAAVRGVVEELLAQGQRPSLGAQRVTDYFSRTWIRRDGVPLGRLVCVYCALATVALQGSASQPLDVPPEFLTSCPELLQLFALNERINACYVCYFLAACFFLFLNLWGLLEGEPSVADFDAAELALFLQALRHIPTEDEGLPGFVKVLGGLRALRFKLKLAI